MFRQKGSEEGHPSSELSFETVSNQEPIRHLHLKLYNNTAIGPVTKSYSE